MTIHHEEPDSSYAVEVGARIHALMWRRKISQAEMGRIVGVGQSTVSAKIRGRVPLTVEELVKIAGALGVDPGDLLPRLDSNQQPSGYPSPPVSDPPAGVVSLADRRRRAVTAVVVPLRTAG